MLLLLVPLPLPLPDDDEEELLVESGVALINRDVEEW